MHRPHPNQASRNPFALPRPSDAADDRRSQLVAFYSEAREAKAFARERLLFRLSKESGVEIAEGAEPPIAPVSASARAEIGNPLGAFLLDALARTGIPERTNS